MHARSLLVIVLVVAHIGCATVRMQPSVYGMYRARFLGHQFDDLGFVWQTIPKTTHEDAPGSTRRGESIPGVAPL